MKLLFTGDFYYDYEDCRKDLQSFADYFSGKDLRLVVNYEGVFDADPNFGQVKKRGVHLSQSKMSVKALKSLNTAAVLLANNHTMDFCEEGLRRTLDELKKEGIPYAGAGKDLESALKPVILKDSIGETAIFNFGWDIEETVYASEKRAGCAPRENTVVLETIRRFAEENPKTAIIPVLHWGFEYSMYPQLFDIELADRLCLIEQVKMVIGHHTHCPQPFEIRHGKPVFYSLGNFYFAGMRDSYKKVFPGEISNRCDYGIVVAYDTSDGSFDAETVLYDRSKKESIILENSPFPEKMPELDHRSEEYRSLVRKCSMKGSPVLGTDEKENKRILLRYGFRRSRVGRTLRMLRDKFCHLRYKSV